ncbi:hypothetical protein BJX62DRAFT_250888 [Aspergillus germanicus]
MPPRDPSERRSHRVSKRVTKACRRCRDQKIRCTGSDPCDQCNKRNYTCHFDSQSERVLVTRRYINDLHERLAAFQRRANQSTSRNASPERHIEPACEATPATAGDTVVPPVNEPAISTHDGRAAKAPLTNPLAFHITDWVPNPLGKPVFMGTSSTWAFGRRVLGMTHERLTGTSLVPNPDELLFDDHVYKLKWNGDKANASDNPFDVSNLPTADFARYLINSVKFHCGQLFFLFEEDRFMTKFATFYQNPGAEARASPLWFCHYLLLLAFGKSFVVQSARSKTPPGAEHFVQAMQCMPDFSFYKGDPVESIQILCCAALYLQCIHSRAPAYRMIGTALRLALEHGMYTEMHGICLDEPYVHRCSLVWWTVYVLERRMSSLLGVPMGISEDSVSAKFAPMASHIHGPNVLEMHVMLCRILAKIDLTVYGTEGKLDSRYLSATQSVLRDIATVTEQLNATFELYINGTIRSTSRISAHLHILEHQCIILTVRPLLYIFLQSKLGQSDPTLLDWLQSGTVKSLLHICVESSQQIVRILCTLQEQGLLETFLPFDMDAAYTSTLPLLMAAAVDPALLSDHSTWSQRAYGVLGEMHTRGNLSAGLMKCELQSLDEKLGQLLLTSLSTNNTVQQGPGPARDLETDPLLSSAGPSEQVDFGVEHGFGAHFELSPGQLIELANSLDLNSLAWPLDGFGV